MPGRQAELGQPPTKPRNVITVLLRWDPLRISVTVVPQLAPVLLSPIGVLVPVALVLVAGAADVVVLSRLSSADRVVVLLSSRSLTRNRTRPRCLMIRPSRHRPLRTRLCRELTLDRPLESRRRSRAKSRSRVPETCLSRAMWLLIEFELISSTGVRVKVV